MRLESIGFQTDLIFWRYGGRVQDRGEYLLVETPRNRGWHFGNLLVFRHLPREGDHERWPALFRREFTHAPEVRHMVFNWRADGERLGLVEPFISAGFRLEINPILGARALHPPPRPNDEMEVRPIDTDDAWAEVLEGHVRHRDGVHEEGPYRRFIERRFDDYRRLVEEGRGAWYGAFAGRRLVGDCGLFREGDTGRYQYVLTHPEYRRRGVAATLVHKVGDAALRAGLVRRLVISAADADVTRIYASVGFEPVERCAALILAPG